MTSATSGGSISSSSMVPVLARVAGFESIFRQMTACSRTDLMTVCVRSTVEAARGRPWSQGFCSHGFQVAQRP